MTLVDALKAQNIQFVYEPCCGVETPFDREAFARATADADVIIAAVGERRSMSGEAASYCDIDLHGEQKALIRALRDCGKPL